MRHKTLILQIWTFTSKMSLKIDHEAGAWNIMTGGLNIPASDGCGPGNLLCQVHRLEEFLIGFSKSAFYDDNSKRWSTCSILKSYCSGSWEPVSRYRANEVHLEVRNLGGIRISEWGANEQRTGKWGVQFTSERRPRWTDPVTARRVPSKWKREQGEQGERAKRNRESKGNAPYTYDLCSCT